MVRLYLKAKGRPKRMATVSSKRKVTPMKRVVPKRKKGESSDRKRFAKTGGRA